MIIMSAILILALLFSIWPYLRLWNLGKRLADAENRYTAEKAHSLLRDQQHWALMSASQKISGNISFSLLRLVGGSALLVKEVYVDGYAFRIYVCHFPSDALPLAEEALRILKNSERTATHSELNN